MNECQALDSKSATVGSTVVTMSSFSFSAGVLSKARYATITSHTAGVVFTYHGGDPTALSGHAIATGGTVQLQGNANVNALRLIRSSSTDATVSITLEG